MKQVKKCPYCGSEDTIPFESEDEYKNNYSFTIIFISAFILIAGYFLFLISSYLYFPVVILILIVVVTKLINLSDKKRKKSTKKVESDKKYLCLSCNKDFSFRSNCEI